MFDGFRARWHTERIPAIDGSSSAGVIAALTDLFTDVPHVMFCVKSTEGTYLAVNQAFVDRTGMGSIDAVLGTRAADLFPPELAASYEAQDDQLRATGQPLRNQLELILRPDGSTGWYVTSKTLIGPTTSPYAIASVSVDLRAPADSSGAHAGVAAALTYARQHATEPISVADMAAAAELTTTQLERAFKRSLGLSVKQVLLRFRLEVVLVRLASSNDSVSTIAAESGYYDQSALTRHFSRVVGMTPGAYRANLNRSNGALSQRGANGATSGSTDTGNSATSSTS